MCRNCTLGSRMSRPKNSGTGLRWPRLFCEPLTGSGRYAIRTLSVAAVVVALPAAVAAAATAAEATRAGDAEHDAVPPPLQLPLPPLPLPGARVGASALRPTPPPGVKEHVKETSPIRLECPSSFLWWDLTYECEASSLNIRRISAYAQGGAALRPPPV